MGDEGVCGDRRRGIRLALIIAWAFEMTPEGIKRTEEVGPDEKIPQWSDANTRASFLSL